LEASADAKAALTHIDLDDPVLREAIQRPNVADALARVGAFGELPSVTVEVDDVFGPSSAVVVRITSLNVAAHTSAAVTLSSKPSWPVVSWMNGAVAGGVLFLEHLTSPILVAAETGKLQYFLTLWPTPELSEQPLPPQYVAHVHFPQWGTVTLRGELAADASVPRGLRFTSVPPAMPPGCLALVAFDVASPTPARISLFGSVMNSPVFDLNTARVHAFHSVANAPPYRSLLQVALNENKSPVDFVVSAASSVQGTGSIAVPRVEDSPAIYVEWRHSRGTMTVEDVAQAEIHRKRAEREQQAAADDAVPPALVIRFAIQTTDATDFEPPSVLAARAVKLQGGQIVVTGGRLPDGTLCRQTALYRPKERKWMLAPPSPAVDRSDHVSVAFGRYVFIHGGIGPTGILGEGERVGIQDDVWRFDVTGATWTRIEVPADRDDFVTHRAGHTAIVYGRYALVFGGETVNVAVVDGRGRDHYVIARDQCDGAVLSFDLVGHRWERHSASPSTMRRHDHTAVALSGKMYCYGGRDASGRESADLLVYDLENRRWVEEVSAGRCPPAMAGHAADVVEIDGAKRMLVLGASRRCCFVFSPSTSWWTEVMVEPSHVRRNLGAMVTISGIRTTQFLCCGGIGAGGRPAKATVAKLEVEPRAAVAAPSLKVAAGNSVALASAVGRISDPAVVQVPAQVAQCHTRQRL
jgi:hypothetical protein